MFYSTTKLFSVLPEFHHCALHMVTLKLCSLYRQNPIHTSTHTPLPSLMFRALPYTQTYTLPVCVRSYLIQIKSKSYLSFLYLIIKKTHLQHLSNPQNTAPSFLLLPIQDLQVIGFSVVSIATLAPSTIYSRVTAPPLLGDRTVLAAATPEWARAHNNSLSLNLETPYPLTASANYVIFFPICL